MKIVTYKTIPQKLKKQVEHLDRICFPWIYETKKSQAENEDKFGPSRKDQIGHICAFIDNNLASRVIIYKKKIKFQGKPLILGGTGGVATIPAYRRQGLATRLLKIAMAELKKANCDIAYLCADVSNPAMIKLYESVGFVLLGRPHVFFGKSGKRYTDNDAMIAPLGSKQKFEQVMTAKETFDIGVGNL